MVAIYSILQIYFFIFIFHAYVKVFFVFPPKTRRAC